MDKTKKSKIMWIVSLAVAAFLGIVLGIMITKTTKIPALRTINSEIMDILDENYYKDYDKDAFKRKSVSGAMDSLNDPYSYVSYSEGSSKATYKGFGFGVSRKRVGLEVGSISKGSPADKAGLFDGDLIIGVDDLYTKTGDLEDILNLFKSRETLTFHIIRNQKFFDITITKDEVNQVLAYSEMKDSIGYLKLNSFQSGSASAFLKELKKIEENNPTGLIIDLRNNPGGSTGELQKMLDEFLVGTEPYMYLEDKAGKFETFKPKKDAKKKNYDIKILVNEKSASASEAFALAMNRVMGYDLIGSYTFGKNVYQSDFELETYEGANLHLTLGYWYGYDKERISNSGIKPTYEVSNDFYIPMVLDNLVYSLDEASDEIKNIELMLNGLGYNVRTDGYFDTILKDTINNNYSSTTLTKEVKQNIYNDYIEYINNPINDKVLNKALDLLK